ncbi:MAG: type II toxin-antitoxin system HicA family toxin [Patescibacteria group bacterium]
MPPFVPISAKRMVKILVHLGFENIRIKGSHHFFLNPISGKTTTIPIHGNESLSIGILKEILRDIEISREEYEKLRRMV